MGPGLRGCSVSAGVPRLMPRSFPRGAPKLLELYGYTLVPAGHEQGMSLNTVRKARGDLDREKRFLAAHAAGHDRIYRYVRRRTESSATAEDLCAEVFRITWEKTAEHDIPSIMVLFGIAKNVLRNHDRSSLRSARLLGALQLERDHGKHASAV